MFKLISRAFSVLVIFFLLSSAPAWASARGYDLRIHLSINGQIVLSPHLLSRAGEPAAIAETAGGIPTFVEVIANEGEIQGRKGILMDFTIGRVDAEGHRVILSRPRVLAQENQIAQIQVGPLPAPGPLAPANSSRREPGVSPSAKVKSLSLSVLVRRQVLVESTHQNEDFGELPENEVE